VPRVFRAPAYKATIVSPNNQKIILLGKYAPILLQLPMIEPAHQRLRFEVGLTKQVNAIKAPMPGLILEINVVVGQTVQENDPLLILEAMKMENSFLSPRDGVIKSIAVTKGDAVDKGQLLIEFE
jgi:biotin carboxyl carrier protein